MLLLLPFASRVAWKQWKGEETTEDSFPDAFARGLPVAVMLGWPFFGLGFALITLPDGPVKSAIVAVEIVVLIAILVLLPSVYLFGRPRRLVPPHLRASIGTSEQWRSNFRPLVRRGAGAAEEPVGDRREVEPSDDAVRAAYRDPWAIATRVGVLGIFLAIEAAFYFMDVTGDWKAAGLLGVTLVVWAGVLRAGVWADSQGLTVRNELRKQLRVSWPEIERFDLEVTDRGLPHASAILKNGDILELEPIEGVELQPKKRRREWAERAVAGLSAQLRTARSR
jgi:hypothetical protein